MPIEFQHDSPKTVPGVTCGAVVANIKKPGRKDLVLFDTGEHSTVACVTTQNLMAAAPVHLVRKHLNAQPRATQTGRYWLINTGYANAATGPGGDAAALEVCEHLAQELKVPLSSILPFSTGVIGEPLPVKTITQALPELVNNLNESHWLDAMHGIITTDTQYKLVNQTIQWGSKQSFIVQGIAKGAGMIKPNMATMLGFITTDLVIPQENLEVILKQAVDTSFNQISVDSDTSTNDCVAIGATGASGLDITSDPELFRVATEVIQEVCLGLALQIIKDGEGATKLVHIQVQGALTQSIAKAIAESVAHSPLLKAAFFASDPNWGRILMAIGKVENSGMDPMTLEVELCGLPLFNNGSRAPSYVEQQFITAMQSDTITVFIDLHNGSGDYEIWGNDLSYEYVQINADYRS